MRVSLEFCDHRCNQKLIHLRSTLHHFLKCLFFFVFSLFFSYFTFCFCVLAEKIEESHFKLRRRLSLGDGKQLLRRCESRCVGYKSGNEVKTGDCKHDLLLVLVRCCRCSCIRMGERVRVDLWTWDVSFSFC